ncbi:MAG: hypothetical protein LBP85_08845 [Prevotellaceae bacterium]|nr:hypothetical protein [Prevotellaceae bacterium]
MNNINNIKGQYNYYPFGKQWEDLNLMANTNRYTFSGKEKQTVKDLGWLDFTARMLSIKALTILVHLFTRAITILLPLKAQTLAAGA